MNLRRVLTPLLFASLVLGSSTAQAGDGDAAAGGVRDAYLQLRDGGCDVKPIGSPIVARALRNVPYALKGKIFKSEELTALFTADGGWYTPSDAAADVDDADRACVRKLDAQEKALRKRVKLKKGIEVALTRHPGAVLDMARLVLSDFRKFTQQEVTRDGLRIWSVNFAEGAGAANVNIECRLPAAAAKAKKPDWTALECNALAAG